MPQMFHEMLHASNVYTLNAVQSTVLQQQIKDTNGKLSCEVSVFKYPAP